MNLTLLPDGFTVPRFIGWGIRVGEWAGCELLSFGPPVGPSLRAGGGKGQEDLFGGKNFQTNRLSPPWHAPTTAAPRLRSTRRSRPVGAVVSS